MPHRSWFVHGALIVLALLSCPSAGAQTPQGDSGERGRPLFLTHFAPYEYAGRPQNWSVTQDQRGVVYVANVSGVLEYDGASWRSIPIPNGSIVRSLATDPDGHVFVGAQGDFGFLAPDSLGTVQFVSLLNEVPQVHRDFGDVWGVQATTDGVFFQTRHRVFYWDGAGIRTWYSTEGYHTSFSVRDTYFVREKRVGLMMFMDGELTLMPEGERFADRWVYVMAPYGVDEILIGTRIGSARPEFFVYDGVQATPFETEATEYLQDYRLYHGTALPGGFYALATIGGGVVVINENGDIVDVLEQGDELPDGTVNFVFADRQGGLWMALHNDGVVRADVPSALSLHGADTGLRGMVYDVTRYDDDLYVATSQGLFKLHRGDGGQEEFEPVWNGGQAWGLLPLDSLLLMSTEAGVYGLRSDGLSPIVGTEELGGVPFTLYHSFFHPDQILVGSKHGVDVLSSADGEWRVQPLLPRSALDKEIRTIAEAPDSSLWLGTASNEVIAVGDVSGRTEVTLYDARHGLPGERIAVANVGDSLRFASTDGFYRYDAAQSRFVLDDLLNPDEPVGALLGFQEDVEGNVWIVYADRVSIAVRQDDGTYVHLAPDVLRLPQRSIQPTLHVDDDGVAWISDGTALVRYDPARLVDRPYVSDFTPLIRRVVAVGTDDVIYGGTWDRAAAEHAVPVLRFHANDIHLAYAAPTFNAPEATEYQIYMEGTDPDWSDWRSETRKTYTNLSPGLHRFRVRARNAQGVVSSEAAFALRVLPPWYRTWWAHLLYLGLGSAFLAFVGRYIQVQKRAKALENEREINERLQQANERLHSANQSLQQANQAKDEFLANTSHELRTPLTAILGFTAILKEEVGGDHQEFLGLIEQSGERLLNTLNSLLDLARLRAGMMEVEKEPVDLAEQALAAAGAYAQAARDKGLALIVDAPDEPVVAEVDRLLFERALFNLIGNAVKFTDEGSVHVRTDVKDGLARLHVQDTGVGIEEAFMPHLFDEFRQESTGLTRDHEGSGLGLAITRRVVTLLDGEISVASEKGVGTVFTLTFPRVAPRSAPAHPAAAPAGVAVGAGGR